MSPDRSDLAGGPNGRLQECPPDAKRKVRDVWDGGISIAAAARLSGNFGPLSSADDGQTAEGQSKSPVPRLHALTSTSHRSPCQRLAASLCPRIFRGQHTRF